MTHYAMCDVISVQKKRFKTEISRQQDIVIKKNKRTCATILKVLSYFATNIFVHRHFNANLGRQFGWNIELKGTGTLPEAGNLKPNFWGNHQGPG